jgi:hypothetical protein
VSKGVHNKDNPVVYLPRQADVQKKGTAGIRSVVLAFFLNKNIFLKINIYVLLSLKIVNFA